MAVAVAKGTLVAGVEAADTLAAVAPCIMGTWREDITHMAHQQKLIMELIVLINKSKGYCRYRYKSKL